MYAFLRGQLVDPGPPTVLECQGVGFEVWIPRRDAHRLPPVGTTFRVFTHLQVREDDHTLYGFLRPRDREIFRSLIGVSGVGPKVALTILGEESSDRLLSTLAAGDPAPLTKVKGIGKKTAERLVVELKDTAHTWLEGVESVVPVAATTQDDDATSALIAMGLSPERARAALDRIGDATRRELGVEELVRRALRHASA